MEPRRAFFTAQFTSFIISFVLIASFSGSPYVAQATGAVPLPKQLPSEFSTSQTLNKLRSSLCGRCNHHGRQRLCRDHGENDVCYLLCGCGNYQGKKCLREGGCACPLIPEEGCPGSQALCIFDDAAICSTTNDICMYYDEKKIHCECRQGWMGENCQTCDDASTSCQLEDKSLEPPVSGSDMTLKALVIACVACLIIGIMIGVFCMCRTGKLVCISTSRVENQVERKDAPPEQKPNTPVARHQSDHAYCHIIQYAVPETGTSQPTSDTSCSTGYTEPNIKHRKNQGNYYFELESPSPCVTYESVRSNRSNSPVTPPHKVSDEVASIDVMKQEADQQSGSREFKSASSSNEYDHLNRWVDANISETSKNYSNLALQEFL